MTKIPKGPEDKQSKEFFDYLAYHGVKNQKAAELEKLKAAEELAQCTFTPQLLSKSPVSKVNKRNFQDLSIVKKDFTKYEAKKQEMEMEGCTFKPNIDKKSKELAVINRGLSSNPSYETLYNKHTAKMEKVKKLI